tara:strand:+ start:2676 stop:3572 length:897 start_codon:yes stop_codon:yes gene_type:complete
VIIPEYLKQGDKIGLVATARKISKKELNPAINLLESWGLQIFYGDNLFQEYNQFSGTISQRVCDIQQMIDDDDIKAIFCVRGGYGTVQIIDLINFDKLLKSPKWIIGYSDVTVLHSHMHNLGLSSMHATMPINFQENTNESIKNLHAALFGLKYCIKASAHRLNKYGTIECEIVGGNLSILYSLLGSSSDIDTAGKILFLEDLDEYLYHIDRMIINLKRNNKFQNIKALIIGAMSNMNDNKIPFGLNAEEIIHMHIKEFNFPVCFGFPAGHINNNQIIKLGVKSSLEINARGVVLRQE